MVTKQVIRVIILCKLELVCISCSWIINFIGALLCLFGLLDVCDGRELLSCLVIQAGGMSTFLKCDRILCLCIHLRSLLSSATLIIMLLLHWVLLHGVVIEWVLFLLCLHDHLFKLVFLFILDHNSTFLIVLIHSIEVLIFCGCRATIILPDLVKAIYSLCELTLLMLLCLVSRLLLLVKVIIREVIVKLELTLFL